MTMLRLLLLAMLSGTAAVAVTAERAPDAPPTTAAADAVPAAVQAVWVEKQLKFVYVANTAYYSCDGLEQRVEKILAAIGARPGFKVQPRGCFSPRRGAEWTPMLDITAASARAVTPETPAAEVASAFPARVMRVDLRDSPTGMLQAGDCELVRQLRDQVFKPLGATIVIDRMGCSIHTLNNDIIVMSLDVLVPADAASLPGH